jgi:predicted amidophosphoribosyltransferase
MNSEQYPNWDKEFRIELSKILDKNEQCGWNTSFCKSCGCDLEGYNNYCQTCKRELKINQIINDTKTRS